MIIILFKAGSFITVPHLIEVLIISGVKFFLAPPIAFYEYKFTYLETFLATTIGGLLGVVFFFYISELILNLFRRIWPSIKNKFSKSIPQPDYKTEELASDLNRKRQFTRKNKFIVNLRRKYGLWGIAFLTPVLLSIPLGTFLASKYFKDKKSILISLAVSVVCWSLVMSSVYAIFKLKHF